VSIQKSLQRQVSGALRAAFVAHGEITKNNMGSASKRIVGQLLATNQIIITEEEFKIRIINFLEYHHSQLLRNREILKKCKNEQNVLTLQAKGKILGKLLNQLRKIVFGREIPVEIEKFLTKKRVFEPKRNSHSNDGRETSIQK